MKKITLSIILLIISAIFAGAQNFTGSYTMRIESAEKKFATEMKINIKGDKIAMDMVTPQNAGKFRMIMDKKEQTNTMLTEKDGGNKMAMVMKMPDMAEPAESKMKETKITKTDETKTIEGYTCKKIIADNEDMTNEVWMTEEVGLNYYDMMGMLNRGRGPAASMTPKMEYYKDIKGMPLEMTITDKKKNGEVTIIKILNLKKGDVDDSVFDITGYKMMDMRNGGRR